MVSLEKLKFWKRQPVIEFFCHPDLDGIIPEPTPAGKNIPSWYKKLPTSVTVSEKDEQNNVELQNIVLTAKKCLPMLDAMTMGFTIPLSADVHVTTNHDCSQILARSPRSSFHAVEFHNHVQVGGHNSIKNNNGHPLKFINRWVIKTAPGWSTLFIPPLNDLDQPFTCLSGIVDTDVYPKEVNFPAIWHIPDYNGVIKAGTPLVTAIAIKRSTLYNKVNIRKMNKEDMEIIDKMARIQGSRENYYTNELRIKK
jgi:hypothetical protein